MLIFFISRRRLEVQITREVKLEVAKEEKLSNSIDRVRFDDDDDDDNELE